MIEHTIEMLYDTYVPETCSSIIRGVLEHQRLEWICTLCQYHPIGRDAPPPLVLMADILNSSHEALRPHRK